MQADPLISGGAAGIACWMVALPMDTVKSRIQNAPPGLSMAACAREIIQAEGVAGLYRGWQPVMLRAAWCNAFCFKALEMTKVLMETSQSPSASE